MNSRGRGNGRIAASPSEAGSLLRRVCRALVVAVLALAADAGGAAAQKAAADSAAVPMVKPGSISTVPVRLSASGTDSADYSVSPDSGVTLLGSRSGRVAPHRGRYLVPVTVQVPAGRPAGPWRLGSVVVRPPAGAPVRRVLRVRVTGRRALNIRAEVPTASASPGGLLSVPYELRNVGNVADTVRLRVEARGRRWPVSSPAAPTPVSRSAVVRDTARVRVPEHLEVGEAARVTLSARSNGDASSEDFVMLHVRRRDTGFLSGVESVPAALFLSTSRVGLGRGSDVELLGSLDASGSVGDGLRLDLFARRRPVANVPGGVRSYLAGPTARAALSGRRWTAAVGYVYARHDPIGGVAFDGRGARASFAGSEWSGELLASRPRGRRTLFADGYRLLGAVEHELGPGRVGLTASAEAERILPGEPLLGSRTGGVRYEFTSADGGERLALRAGWMQLVRDGDLVRQGPAGEASVRVGGDRTGLWAHARRLPGTWPSGSFLSDEVRAGGRLGLGPAVSALARGFYTSTSVPTRRPGRDRRGVEAGVRITPGEKTVRLTAGIDGRRDSAGAAWSRDYEVSADLRWPAGRWTFRTGVDVEREAARAGGVAGRDGWGVDRLRAGIRLAAGNLSASASAFATEPFRSGRRLGSPVNLSLRGVWEGGGVGVEGQAFTLGSLSEPGRSVDGWARLRVDATSRAALVTTIEHRAEAFRSGGRGAGTREAWSATFGVQVELDMPLPITRGGALRGVVFHDRNGNLRREPGEEGLEGIRLTKGFVRVRTGDRGRFRVRDGAVSERRLRVEPATLPEGTVVPPGTRMPKSGTVEIPVVRLAGLRVRLFRDRDGDGQRDDGEPEVTRATLRLASASGSGRTYTQEVGRRGGAAFGAVLPGQYELSVHVPGSTYREPVDLVREVELSPGTDRELLWPIPPSEKPIEGFSPGSSPGGDGPTGRSLREPVSAR